MDSLIPYMKIPPDILQFYYFLFFHIHATVIFSLSGLYRPVPEARA